MVKIMFKRMRILKDKRTVGIIGEYRGKEIEIELSVLQLAKVFQCDKDVLKEQERYGWGSRELEEKCEEIIDIIKRFPNVKIVENKIGVEDISVIDNSKIKYYLNTKENIVKIFGEDLSGWENEGIKIRFPADLYRQDLEGKDFNFILKQDSIELKII